MLKGLLEQKMDEGNYSIRQAAKEIGIAHTTLGRVLNGDDIDLSTLKQICAWLEVSPADVLIAEGDMEDPSTLSAQLTLLIKMSPSLEQVFHEVLDKYQNGGLSADAVQELMHYASYRLGVEAATGRDEVEVDVLHQSDRPSHSG